MCPSRGDHKGYWPIEAERNLAGNSGWYFNIIFFYESVHIWKKEYLPVIFRRFLSKCYQKSALVQEMAWSWVATSHFLNQCWNRYMTQICGYRPQWVKRKGVKMEEKWNTSKAILLTFYILEFLMIFIWNKQYLGWCWTDIHPSVWPISFPRRNELLC